MRMVAGAAWGGSACPDGRLDGHDGGGGTIMCVVNGFDEMCEEAIELWREKVCYLAR